MKRPKSDYAMGCLIAGVYSLAIAYIVGLIALIWAVIGWLSRH